MTGAEVDSAARDLVLQCDPDVRKALRDGIHDWGVDPKRDAGMLWVIGPGNVGKTTIAQTVAERFRVLGRLGASLFFSGRDGRDDPDKIIPSLIYQLTLQHPGYKRAVAGYLRGDPTIFEKNREAQFLGLVVEPFQRFASASAPPWPLVIVLDGLDKCRGIEAQCEIMKLIRYFVQNVNYPIRWMIYSRPERYLEESFSPLGFEVTCIRVKISINDDEGYQGTHIIGITCHWL
ncbi:hypothetical protein P691DRAFT_667926 [Macrolepiota fuliginosa MF-IS2]|uniref:Nephrocystin 3-like N-terminal domain-containing protein n=1 Tax=Macrolepiota fuliginosa MF-IS2 TaxID=1400762 RepID=A0A9P5XG56_9AGAR|nr:hypothetical protein P691DRAFT_667926 [Macrolepiota fuliginosa MF-IS2]